MKPPSTRAERIRVLAVFGNAVIDDAFCGRFFDDPVATAADALHDRLSPYEQFVLEQIHDYSLEHPGELRARFMTARGGRVNCPCPPCPDPI